MADDLGYSDLSCYGSEIQTPNLDRLADNGLKFTHYYTTPMCVTSRVAFLAGMEFKAAGGEGLPNATSLPVLLRDAGYSTHIVGKNHGMTNFRIGDPDTDYGFDHFYGFSGGELNSFTGEGRVEWQDDGHIFSQSELPEDFYTTKDFTDYSIRYMKEAIDQDKPFFSFVAYNAPHTPLHAPEKNVRKYYDPAKGVNVYKDGWEKMREQRLERMKQLGIVDHSVELSDPGVEIPDWELLPDTSSNPWDLQKKFEYLSRSAYAGMVDNMDENIGRIVDFLKDPNGDGNEEDSELDNTIIVFVSDNGGCYAGLYTNRNALPWNKNNGWFTTNYGWGTLSNTPFRYYKHASHEGALRSPMIIHWPDGLKVPKGELNRNMLRIWDLYPTFLELAQTELPATGAEKKPLMGKSFVSLLKGDHFEPENYFVLAFHRTRGVVKDNWKLTSYFDSPFELYNLKNDPVENNDLAKQNPEIYKQLIKEWRTYAEHHGFADDSKWNRSVGDVRRGWGYDFLPAGITATVPVCMSDEVAIDEKLQITFTGALDFSNTEGKKIRLQKYGDSTILWSADPDQSSRFQGKRIITFDDFPVLEPDTHYYITWDTGWAKFNDQGKVRPISYVKESAFAFRFRTKKIDRSSM
ncbi:arylsulfatase [Marinoscillum furvescens DSM 4134]|uniref:Arylsulfatase n=2 Tax=Marinoscillum furvescens TaxID=1026 RepID=A0A3D9L1T5_MARFU|nr:arylsulfatase [Marinoscillum furvescens DSM 4134]